MSGCGARTAAGSLEAVFEFVGCGAFRLDLQDWPPCSRRLAAEMVTAAAPGPMSVKRSRRSILMRTRLDAALRKSLKLSERWLAMPPVELKSLVQEIVDRITVAADWIEIQLSRAKIAAALQVGERGQRPDLDPVVLSIAAKVRRAGKGKRLVIRNGAETEVNAGLVELIKEAFANSKPVPLWLSLVRRRLTEAVKWWGEPIGIVTEIVPRFAFNLRHCPRTLPQAGRKNVRKGLDFFWEQSVTGPTSGSAKGSPGIPPRRLHCLCGASVVAAQAASTQQGIPTMSLKKLSSKQHPPDGLKAGSGACDAPQQTGRDHCHHDAGNWLAASLGPRLFDSRGAQ